MNPKACMVASTGARTGLARASRESEPGDIRQPLAGRLIMAAAGWSSLAVAEPTANLPPTSLHYQDAGIEANRIGASRQGRGLASPLFADDPLGALALARELAPVKPCNLLDALLRFGRPAAVEFFGERVAALRLGRALLGQIPKDDRPDLAFLALFTVRPRGAPLLQPWPSNEIRVIRGYGMSYHLVVKNGNRIGPAQNRSLRFKAVSKSRFSLKTHSSRLGVAIIVFRKDQDRYWNWTELVQEAIYLRGYNPWAAKEAE